MSDLSKFDAPTADLFTITIVTEALPNGQMFSVIETDVEVSAHEQVATLTNALSEALQKTEYTPPQEEKMLRWILECLGIHIQSRAPGSTHPYC